MTCGWPTSAASSGSSSSLPSARSLAATKFDSDIDLLYTLAPDARLGFDLDRLEDELASLFGRPDDLVSKKALHRLLRDQVLSEARTLYAA